MFGILFLLLSASSSKLCLPFDLISSPDLSVRGRERRASCLGWPYLTAWVSSSRGELWFALTRECCQHLPSSLEQIFGGTSLPLGTQMLGKHFACRFKDSEASIRSKAKLQRWPHSQSVVLSPLSSHILLWVAVLWLPASYPFLPAPLANERPSVAAVHCSISSSGPSS